MTATHSTTTDPPDWGHLVHLAVLPETADKTAALAREFTAAHNPDAVMATIDATERTIEFILEDAIASIDGYSAAYPERAAMFAEWTDAANKAKETITAAKARAQADFPRWTPPEPGSPPEQSAYWHAKCFECLTAAIAMDSHRRAAEKAAAQNDPALRSARVAAMEHIYSLSNEIAESVGEAYPAVSEQSRGLPRRAQRAERRRMEQLLNRVITAQEQWTEDYTLGRNGHRANLPVVMHGLLENTTETNPATAGELTEQAKRAATWHPGEIALINITFGAAENPGTGPAKFAFKIVEHEAKLWMSQLSDPFPEGYPASVVIAELGDQGDDESVGKLLDAGDVESATTLNQIRLQVSLAELGLHAVPEPQMRELGKVLDEELGGDHYAVSAALTAIADGDPITAAELARLCGRGETDAFLPEHVVGLVKAAREMGMSETGVALLREALDCDLIYEDQPDLSEVKAENITPDAGRRILAELSRAGAQPESLEALADFLDPDGQWQDITG